MNKVDVVDYEVWFYNEDKPTMVEQTTGEKLMALWASDNCPDKIAFNGGMVASSAIKKIMPRERWTTGEDDRGIGQRERETRELSSAESKVHDKYLEITGQHTLLDK